MQCNLKCEMPLFYFLLSPPHSRPTSFRQSVKEARIRDHPSHSAGINNITTMSSNEKAAASAVRLPLSTD